MYSISLADHAMAVMGTLFSVVAIICTSSRSVDTITSMAVTLSDSVCAFASLSLLIPRRRFCFGVNICGAVVSAVATVFAILNISPPTIDLVMRPALHFAISVGSVCTSGSWIVRHPGWSMREPVRFGSLLGYSHALMWLITMLIVVADGGCSARPLMSISATASLVVAYATMVYESGVSSEDRFWDIIVPDRWGLIRERFESLPFSLACVLIGISQAFVTLILPLFGDSACSPKHPADCTWAPPRLLLSSGLMACDCILLFARCALA